MLLPPANTNWVPVIPVLPAVLPIFEMPPENAAAVFARIVTDWPFWLSVMLLPPARMIVPEEMSARVPVVFPESDAASMFWVCTLWVVSHAGTPREIPDVFRVPTRTLPAVEVEVNPVPAMAPEAWVWADWEALAVIVPLFKPNETLLEFERVMPPNAPELVPADTERVAAATVLAEIVTD